MKVLIIQTASIGDVILATPVLEGIHATMPSAVIHMMVKKGMEGLFRGHPFLGDVLVWDKDRKYSAAFKLLGRIRKERYDAVINIQRFALTGLITGFSGAGKKIGFGKNPFSILFSQRAEHLIGEGVHETDRNLSLLKPLVSGQQWQELMGSGRPKLYPSAADKEVTGRYKSEPYVTISPASLWFTKQFPATKWAELIQALPDQTRVYLLGSAADQGLCNEIISLSGRNNVTQLAGRLSFLESAALMEDAMMNYTNDSAPLHLASAVNAPSAVVYCSTVPSFGFGPLSEIRTIVQTVKTLKCRPCGLHGLRECPEGHFDCAMSINAHQFPLPSAANQKF